MSFYDLTASTLRDAEGSSSQIKFSSFKGKVVLILNVASLWGTTTRDYLQMNELLERFGDRLVILAFPCSQFSHEENGDGEEIRLNLRHVRPGNGFQTRASLMEKVNVNGADAHPVFKWLREKMPMPSDDAVSLMSDPGYIIWRPVTRTDVSWNFEKFLIDSKGNPVKRYSRHFLTKNVAEDIVKLV